MSSPPPSAFDVLMSNARAAAGNSSAPKSPFKKTKLSDPLPPSQTIIPSETLIPPDSVLDPQTEAPNLLIPTPKNTKDHKQLLPYKDRIAELKGRIELLKTKSPEFTSDMVVCWDKDESVPFLFLSLTFDLISQESGRTVISEIVRNMLRCVIDTTPEDLLPIVYLSACKIAPAHKEVEMGIGEAMIIKALAEACGRTEKMVKNQYEEKRDLGLVAKEISSSQSLIYNYKPEALTVAEVLSTFRKIAKESGKESQDRKINHIKKLLVAATDCERQYITHLLQSKLRIRFSEKTLLAALGHAALYCKKHPAQTRNAESPSDLDEAAKIVQRVYSVLPVYDQIVSALLTDSVWNLSHTCHFTLGVPVRPMLAKATKSVSEILSKFQDMEYICEYKYDGERVQIHYEEDDSVEIYSRNAERTTVKYHDVVDTIARVKNSSVTSFVLDCEIVAYDRAKGKNLRRQALSTRARKNVDKNDIKVPVCVYAFDLLYINGQCILQEQLKSRRKHLYSAFVEKPGFFQFATATVSNDVEEIPKFLDAAVEASCEGLIIKTLSSDATYEPSMRSNNWLKLKKDCMEKIGDSLDLVPIGAFHGRGKRTGVYGSFLLACYDSTKGEFQSISKIGTGFSEAVLEERSNSLRSQVISTPWSYYKFGGMTRPDVWFEASEVWEVKGADLAISPVYHAAIGEVDNDKGISLLFPRLLGVRVDKYPEEEATSSEQVAEMYRAKNSHQNNQDDDGDIE